MAKKRLLITKVFIIDKIKNYNFTKHRKFFKIAIVLALTKKIKTKLLENFDDFIIFLIENAILFTAILILNITIRAIFLFEYYDIFLKENIRALYSYFILQDLLGLLLIFFGSNLISLAFTQHRKLRIILWSIYLFFIGVLYLGNLNYYRLYAENFSWSHLKKEGIPLELWSSSLEEVNIFLILKVCLLFLFCLLFLLLSFKIIPLKKEKKIKNISNVKKKLIPSWNFNLRFFNFSLCFFVLLFAVITNGFQFLHQKEPKGQKGNDASYKDKLTDAQFSQDKDRLSNVLWQSFFPHSYKLKQEDRINFFAQEWKSNNFEYGFDSSSKIDSKRNKIIPFKRNRKYNIVLYLFESTAYSYLQNKTPQAKITPNWEKLTKNAIVFEKHYVQSPLSVNSLFSIMTSAYSMPADIWVIRKYPQIPLASIPQILNKYGYRNAFFHTGRLSYVGQNNFLKNRGFKLLQDAKELAKPPYNKALNWGIDDRALIKAARNFAKISNKNKEAYFMVLSPLSPHHPYDIPEEKFRIIKNSDISDYNFIKNNWSFTVNIRSFGRYLNSLYYADNVLQKLVSVLENMPGGDNTLFFILADHGEAFGQHKGNFNHPFYLYEENIHIPFIIYNRKLFPKSIYFSNISRHIDVLPTILDCLGLKINQNYEGISLLRGAKAQIASFHTSWRNHLAGLRDADWKYILNLSYGKEELYDLKKDPNEKFNIRHKFPHISKKYHDYLLKLHSYQRKYFETVLQKPINWHNQIDKTDL